MVDWTLILLVLKHTVLYQHESMDNTTAEGSLTFTSPSPQQDHMTNRLQILLPTHITRFQQPIHLRRSLMDPKVVPPRLAVMSVCRHAATPNDPIGTWGSRC